MFFVLIVHVDFWSLGTPTHETFVSAPHETFWKVFFETLTIGCVNLFVMISGWFGIHPNIKSFSNFIFQCLFYSIGIYIFCHCIGIADLSATGLIKESILSFTLEYWFVLSYLILYLFAPILNNFVENTNRSKLKKFLILFYAFQTFYVFITGQAYDFNKGFDVLSFMGLYLLTRYMRLYPNKYTTLPRKYDILTFFSLVILQTIIGLVALKFSIPGFNRIYIFANPVLIISCAYFLLYFSKLHFHNKLINWCAASSFAVYLLHQHFMIRHYYSDAVIKIYTDYPGGKFILPILIFIISIFIISILIDQIRILIWNIIVKKHGKNNQPNY